MKKLHIVLTLFLILNLNGRLFSQPFDCQWVGPTTGTPSFNDPANWLCGGSVPSAINDQCDITVNAVGFTMKLNANCTVNKLVLRGGKIDFQGYELSIDDNIEFYNNDTNPIILDNSNPSSKIKYTTNAITKRLYVQDYTNFTLSDFLYPEGATKPSDVQLLNATLSLSQATSIPNLRFLDNIDTSYLNLNGYDLTVNRYYVYKERGFLIPHENSNLIFHNLFQNTNNLRFANTSKVVITSGIQLKSIQKTGSDGLTATIIGNVELSEKITCANGKIYFTNLVTLLSDATHTAFVGESAGAIETRNSTGFIVQQYIPGRRVFRFLAHPFNTSIALNQVTDDIDITGSGGSNGFTATPNNNPSAFYFDPSAADNTSSGLNPGWKAFTSANTNSWAKATPALIYIRGAKGEGLDGIAYTPSAVTLNMRGMINTGTQNITLSKGSNSDFVTVGNPYPSPIQMQSITSSNRSNVSSTYWVFDSNLGANGGYVSKLWDTDSYVLPAYAGFATEVSASGSITFEETDKSTETPADIFLGGSLASDLLLNVFVKDHLYDQTRLIANDQASDIKDYFDGAKMENADINFFTLSKDGKQLSIDSRTFGSESERIALGLFSNVSRNITIQADASPFLDAHQVTLIDHFTDKTYLLNDGIAVDLNIDLKNPKTFGTERLELQIAQINSNIQKPAQEQAHALIFPNPSSTGNTLNVQANAAISGIVVRDLSGKILWETSIENTNKNAEIPAIVMQNAGIYFIDIHTHLGHTSLKHIVQF